MSLAERERAARPTRLPGPVCSVRRAAAGLDQDDADALHRLVFKRLDLSGPEVSDLLHEEGIEISPDTVNRHRAGRCAKCGRE